MDPILEQLEQIEESLRTRAFLYDHPAAYQEGISAALIAVREALESFDAVA